MTLNNDRYVNVSKNVNNPCKLRVIHSNCQSAMNKQSELSGLIDEHNPHVLALTEFGAAAFVNDGELGIEGYALYRGNHSSGNGGLGKGAALYVRESLIHSSCPLFDKEEFDCHAWCAVKLSDNQRLLIGVVYRSPNSPEENNRKMLEILRRASGAGFDYLMVCGDFNLPNVDWSVNQCLDSEGSFTADFMEVVEELDWTQHSRNHTRFRGSQKSCLDLVFTNEANMIEEVLELPPVGKSDHACQMWDLTVKDVVLQNTTARRLNYRRAEWTVIRDDIDKFSLDPNDSTNAMMDNFISMVNKTKRENIPMCKPRSLKHRLPWMRGARIKKQRFEKWKSWTKFKKTSLPRDYDMYKMERNRLKDLIREAKCQHEAGLITGLKSNPNLYYGHCRRSLKTKQGVTSVVDGNGKLTETEIETATALNKYYYSVFTKDDPTAGIPAFPAQTEEQLIDVPITTELVEEALLAVNPNKAAGPDKIENRFLKECAEDLAPKLHQIFRNSIDKGEVPDQWKEAHIVPIHKGGPKSIMANFRPVALTSAICKVLEKIIVAAIMCFLVQNNLVSNQQHGFVRGRSCQTNIVLCLEKWTQMLDEGKSVDVTYFDYAKAFDKVSHRLLLVKLKAYGIEGKLLKWIEAWLTNRKQKVIVGNAESPWLEVVSGTTQGTVLGFLLFLVFINDLPSQCSQEDESQIMLLADDTKTFQEIGKEDAGESCRMLQNRVNRIAQWATNWRMEINPGKSKVMHLGKDNPGHTYYINGSEIKSVTTEKDIGFLDIQ